MIKIPKGQVLGRTHLILNKVEFFVWERWEIDWQEGNQRPILIPRIHRVMERHPHWLTKISTDKSNSISYFVPQNEFAAWLNTFWVQIVAIFEGIISYIEYLYSHSPHL